MNRASRIKQNNDAAKGAFSADRPPASFAFWQPFTISAIDIVIVTLAANHSDGLHKAHQFILKNVLY